MAEDKPVQVRGSTSVGNMGKSTEVSAKQEHERNRVFKEMSLRR